MTKNWKDEKLEDIRYMYGRKMFVAQGGGGGHSLVWLARPYDLIAEGVKVGWSSIVIS